MNKNVATKPNVILLLQDNNGVDNDNNDNNNRNNNNNKNKNIYNIIIII